MPHARSFRTHRIHPLAALLGVALLAACSPTDGTSPASASSAEATASEAPSASDPCSLLTTAEVRSVLPDANAGKREHRTDEYGIASCLWDTPKGRLALQVSAAEEGPPNEIVGLVVMGNLDPGNRKANEAIRYETLEGIGDQAVAVVESRNEERGILGDITAAGVRRGSHDMVLMSSPLGGGDRDAALKSLTELARAAAARM